MTVYAYGDFETPSYRHMDMRHGQFRSCCLEGHATVRAAAEHGAEIEVADWAAPPSDVPEQP